MGQRVIKVDSHFNPVTLGDFYNSPDDDCRLVVLTSRDVTVLRAGLLPFYWPTRFGEYIAPNRFRVSDDSDLIKLLEVLEVKLMGCDIADSINSVAKAIELLAKSQCCDSGDIIVNVNGGINGSLSDGSVTYGTEPYSDAPEDTPSGYEDGEQYDSQKCAMANQMVSDIIYFLSVLSGAGGVSAIGGLVVTVLGVLAIIAIPQVVIPTLIAAVAVAFLAGGTLYAVSLEVESRRQEIVCVLISNNNLDVIIESLADIIDVIIASVGASSPVGAAIKTILLIFFNSETLNKLYAEYAGFMYPEADCSDCGAVPISIIIACDTPLGQIEDSEGTTWVLSSLPFNWSCDPESPMYSIAFTVGANCTVNVLEGDQTWWAMSAGSSNYSNTTWGAIYPSGVTLGEGDSVGFHVETGSGSPFELTIEIVAI